MRDTLDDRTHEVGAVGFERHVHEAAADRAAGDGRERPVEPRQEHHAARGGAGSTEHGVEPSERRVDTVVAQLVVGVHETFEHVLHDLAAQPVLRAHDVTVDLGPGHREDLVLEVGAEVRDPVDQHARRPDREARPTGEERARGDRDAGGVVGGGVDDGGRGQSERGRDVREQRTDLGVDANQRRQARRVHARERDQLVVVRGRAERAVVAALHHERRVLRRGDAPGEPRAHVVHRLDVRGCRRRYRE